MHPSAHDPARASTRPACCCMYAVQHVRCSRMRSQLTKCILRPEAKHLSAYGSIHKLLLHRVRLRRDEPTIAHCRAKGRRDQCSTVLLFFPSCFCAPLPVYVHAHILPSSSRPTLLDDTFRRGGDPTRRARVCPKWFPCKVVVSFVAKVAQTC